MSPDHVRSGQGPEFIAIAVREWIAAIGARTAFIEKATRWQTDVIDKPFARSVRYNIDAHG